MSTICFSESAVKGFGDYSFGISKDSLEAAIVDKYEFSLTPIQRKTSKYYKNSDSMSLIVLKNVILLYDFELGRRKYNVEFEINAKNVFFAYEFSGDGDTNLYSTTSDLKYFYDVFTTKFGKPKKTTEVIKKLIPNDGTLFRHAVWDIPDFDVYIGVEMQGGMYDVYVPKAIVVSKILKAAYKEVLREAAESF